MADLPRTPITRQEEYLSRLAGENTTLPREPITREEMYLEGAIARVEAVEEEVEEIKSNPDVVDVVGTYADLQAYDTSTLTDKDIIRVLEDSTHSNNSTFYRWNATTNQFDYVGEVSGGGDSVYSTKTTSNQSDGGAVFIGPLNASQTPLLDPTTTDNHYRYFWAMPFDTSGQDNFGIPSDETINIGGQQNGTPHNTTVGYRTKVLGGDSNTVLGYQAEAKGYSSNVVIGDSATSTAGSAVVIGRQAQTSFNGTVALGSYSQPTRIGEVNVGTSQSGYGYGNTNYRVIGGVHDGVDLHDAATVGQLSYRQKKPVTVWEVDGTTVTTGLVGVNEDISATPNWQLTGLDLTLFARIKIYSKAAQKAGSTASASTTPAIILEMSLDPRAAIAEYGGNYVGSVVVQKPNDANRLCTLCCAVSADKTKFEVLRMTNLYGTAATSNSDVNAYVFKIEGYYE